MIDSPTNRTSGYPTPRINRLSSSISSTRLRPAFTGASASPTNEATHHFASPQARTRSKHQFPRKWRMDGTRAEGKVRTRSVTGPAGLRNEMIRRAGAEWERGEMMEKPRGPPEDNDFQMHFRRDIASRCGVQPVMCVNENRDRSLILHVTVTQWLTPVNKGFGSLALTDWTDWESVLTPVEIVK